MKLRGYGELLALALVPLLSIQTLAAMGESHPDAIFKLEPYRTRWAISAVVGGHVRKYLLDTGGGLTLISRKAALEAGCTPWGRLTGFNMFAARGDSERCDNVGLDIGESHFLLPTVGLIDMGKLNAKDTELDGIIALNLFEGRAITLELGEGRLTIESPASLATRVATMTPVPILLTREVQGHALSVSVGVPSKNGSLWMELDSGNGGTILVSKPVAALVGLNPGSDQKQNADFALAGGIRVISSDAFVPDLILDGNLGMPFLRTCKLTLDLQSAKGWIAPGKSAAAHDSKAAGRP